MMWGLAIAGVLLVGGAISLAWRAANTPAPAALGVTGGQLSPCPDSPNCVSSRASDESKRMDPWPFVGSATETRDRLVRILESLPDATVVTNRDDYIHCEFRSRLFRFVDDIEFLLDDSEEQVHFRSASRVGHSDLGVNRARMDRIGRRYGTTDP